VGGGGSIARSRKEESVGTAAPRRTFRFMGGGVDGNTKDRSTADRYRWAVGTKVGAFGDGKTRRFHSVGEKKGKIKRTGEVGKG